MTGNWQPIETAPLNESVLVYIPNTEHYGDGIWRAIHVDMRAVKRWQTTGWACGRDLPSDVQPTHWMPLPEPPERVE
jgi:hypothetical protein